MAKSFARIRQKDKSDTKKLDGVQLPQGPTAITQPWRGVALRWLSGEVEGGWRETVDSVDYSGFRWFCIALAPQDAFKRHLKIIGVHIKHCKALLGIVPSTLKCK